MEVAPEILARITLGVKSYISNYTYENYVLFCLYTSSVNQHFKTNHTFIKQKRN